MTTGDNERQPGTERQRMDVDVVCVGFGPATGGFLTTLSRELVNGDGTPKLESATSPGMPPQVICYERADDIGFGVSGVVTRARGIRQTFPDLDPSQIPLCAPGSSANAASSSSLFQCPRPMNPQSPPLLA
jgi:hypothetical protein